MNEEFYGDEFDGGFQALLGKEGDDEFNRVLLEDETSECESYEDEAVRTARNAFGVRFLFPWQRIVISNILDSAKNIQSDSSFADNFDDDEFCRGRQIVLLPTGAGKSMCFLVPSLILPGATLIFYPLLALMADQKRRMDEADISCVVLKGGQSEIEREEIFRKIEGKDGSPTKVILANPEVLQNEKILARLSKCDISHVAIDEAHCACEWGDTFRSAYLTLGKIIGKLGVKIATAFTATASPVVLKRVGEIIFDGHFHLVRGDSDRANIHYSVLHAYAKEKAALECALKMKKPMIIFCGTRGRTENMARILLEVFGREKVRFYHAGMTKEEKHSVEKWFFDSDDGILTATCAYGMGMDKGNIYSVVHLDAPNHLENFIQEAGRAGRKGDDVHSVLIWNHADFARYENSEKGSRERVMGDFVLEKNCRRQFMLDYLGGEKTVCSGCDLCDARKTGRKISDKAYDAEFAFKFIKRNRKVFRKNEISSELTRKFNGMKLGLFGMNVWEDCDSASIISQLVSEGRVRILGGMWRGRLDVVTEKSRGKEKAGARNSENEFSRKIIATAFRKEKIRNLLLLSFHLLHSIRLFSRRHLQEEYS
ncbi:MAG: ATP-dependent DNA helicase RecQ [Treponema sp.]|nr:ATP-dependent DNA helicase RecQ [Treponema sp.]